MFVIPRVCRLQFLSIYGLLIVQKKISTIYKIGLTLTVFLRPLVPGFWPSKGWVGNSTMDLLCCGILVALYENKKFKVFKLYISLYDIPQNFITWNMEPILEHPKTITVIAILNYPMKEKIYHKWKIISYRNNAIFGEFWLCSNFG